MWRVATDNKLLLVYRYSPAISPLGCITQIHASCEGLVRVVIMKTATITVRR
jgi:hypothetical protein